MFTRGNPPFSPIPFSVIGHASVCDQCYLARAIACAKGVSDWPRLAIESCLGRA